MQIVRILISIAIAQAAGLLGSFFTAASIRTWYVDIAKPTWNPPSWIFGPVWISLYTLMGIAAYLVWKNKGVSGVPVALSVYGIHLILNALWSVLFFGLQNPGAAFIEILILLVFIVVTMALFWRISPLAGALLIPYLGWVLFAAYLNYTIWQLN